MTPNLLLFLISQREDARYLTVEEVLKNKLGIQKPTSSTSSSKSTKVKQQIAFSHSSMSKSFESKLHYLRVTFEQLMQGIKKLLHRRNNAAETQRCYTCLPMEFPQTAHRGTSPLKSDQTMLG